MKDNKKDIDLDQNTQSSEDITMSQIKPDTQPETGDSIIMEDRKPSILEPEGLNSYAQAAEQKKVEDQKVIQKESQMKTNNGKAKKVILSVLGGLLVVVILSLS
ncbi:hypothetical protein KW795_01355, partial [Candidatus Microgenomates bacterium]|nr:hypothetical protein [Candidatus Microgenomates bacterium]